MADLFVDRLETTNATFERGVARSCTRKCRVGLTTEVTGQEGYLSLTIARTFLRTKGFVEMEPMGESPDILDATSGQEFAPLILVKMDLAMADDKYWVDATLHYAHIADGANQAFVPQVGPTNELIWGKGRTSIVEKTTNFFYPFGDRTKPKTMLEVGHQFAVTDQRMSAVPHDPNYPRYVRQGGEISIPFPQSNYKFEAIVETRYPAALAESLIAKINDRVWMGMPQHTWLITEVTYEVNNPARVQNVTLPTYKMGFEFQYNSDTWNPTIAFKDQETGNTPASAVIGTVADGDGVFRYQLLPKFVPGVGFIGMFPVPAGYWQVPALGRINFDAEFHAIFEASNR